MKETHISQVSNNSICGEADKKNHEENSSICCEADMDADKENNSICSDADKENHEENNSMCSDRETTILQRPSPENSKPLEVRENVELVNEIPMSLAVVKEEIIQSKVTVDDALEQNIDLPVDENRIQVDKKESSNILMIEATTAETNSQVEAMTVDEPKEQPMEVSTPEFINKLKSIPTGRTVDKRRLDSPVTHIQITVQDPNKNIINPFLYCAPEKPVEPERSSKEGKKETRKTIYNTKLPSKAPFYSPVLRKSLDRKAKASYIKPTAVRRTLYEAVAKPGTSRPAADKKTPTMIPQPKPLPRPKMHKCSASGCSSEFPTFRAYQEHQKTHKATTLTCSFNCKWCDKKFQLEVALLNHQIEKCLQMPFNEKRKLIAQRDSKEKDRRRTTLFPMPDSQRKSPKRKRTDINKSGIVITPKRSLKCHVCQFIVPDAFKLANHILSHKFDKEKVVA